MDSVVQQNRIPADDPKRSLAIAQPDLDVNRPYIGIVGDTYTVLLSGKETAGRFCLIDMHVPPGGGPPAHRHDFEETFTLLEGELEVTFRGITQTARSPITIHIPANAPHQFRNSSAQPARLLCICSPAGRKISSWSSARWSPLAPRLLGHSTMPHKQNSERRPSAWLPSIRQNFSIRPRLPRTCASGRPSH